MGRKASVRTATQPPWWADGVEPARRPYPGVDGAACPPCPDLPWLPDGVARRRVPGPALCSRLPGRLRPLVALLAAGVLAVAVAVVVLVRAGSTGDSVTTPFLSYTAPAGWTTAATDADTAPDAAALAGVVHGPGYECGGERFLRGFAAAALLPTDAAGSPGELAERLARWFAATAYSAPDGTPPDVSVGPERPVPVSGPVGAVTGTAVEISVRARAGREGCAATAATLLALGAPTSGGTALLLVAADTAGGPARPAAPDRATLDAALASVRLGPP
jgi:hypothetical protein